MTRLDWERRRLADKMARPVPPDGARKPARRRKRRSRRSKARSGPTVPCPDCGCASRVYSHPVGCRTAYCFVCRLGWGPVRS